MWLSYGSKNDVVIILGGSAREPPPSLSKYLDGETGVFDYVSQIATWSLEAFFTKSFHDYAIQCAHEIIWLNLNYNLVDVRFFLNALRHHALDKHADHIDLLASTSRHRLEVALSCVLILLCIIDV